MKNKLTTPVLKALKELDKLVKKDSPLTFKSIGKEVAKIAELEYIICGQLLDDLDEDL